MVLLLERTAARTLGLSLRLDNPSICMQLVPGVFRQRKVIRKDFHLYCRPVLLGSSALGLREP